jgi:hypothetical protein
MRMGYFVDGGFCGFGGFGGLCIAYGVLPMAYCLWCIAYGVLRIVDCVLDNTQYVRALLAYLAE